MKGGNKITIAYEFITKHYIKKTYQRRHYIFWVVKFAPATKLAPLSLQKVLQTEMENEVNTFRNKCKKSLNNLNSSLPDNLARRVFPEGIHFQR